MKTKLSLLEQETWRTNEWEENSIKTLKRGRLNFKQMSWRTREGYWTVIVIKGENLKVRNYWHHKNKSWSLLKQTNWMKQRCEVKTSWTSKFNPKSKRVLNDRNKEEFTLIKTREDYL